MLFGNLVKLLRAAFVSVLNVGVTLLKVIFGIGLFGLGLVVSVPLLITKMIVRIFNELYEHGPVAALVTLAKTPVYVLTPVAWAVASLGIMLAHLIESPFVGFSLGSRGFVDYFNSFEFDIIDKIPGVLNNLLLWNRLGRNQSVSFLVDILMGFTASAFTNNVLIAIPPHLDYELSHEMTQALPANTRNPTSASQPSSRNHSPAAPANRRSPTPVSQPSSRNHSPAAPANRRSPTPVSQPSSRNHPPAAPANRRSPTPVSQPSSRNHSPAVTQKSFKPATPLLLDAIAFTDEELVAILAKQQPLLTNSEINELNILDKNLVEKYNSLQSKLNDECPMSVAIPSPEDAIVLVRQERAQATAPWKNVSLLMDVFSKTELNEWYTNPHNNGMPIHPTNNAVYLNETPEQNYRYRFHAMYIESGSNEKISEELFDLISAARTLIEQAKRDALAIPAIIESGVFSAQGLDNHANATADDLEFSNSMH